MNEANSHVAQDQDRHPALTLLSLLFEPGDIVEFRPIETWTENQKKQHRLLGRRWATMGNGEFEDALDWLRWENSEENGNAFFGVCPRPAIGTGKSADIRIVRGLWSDLDLCTEGEARRRIDAAGLPSPSIIINSGHGVHLYWLLAEAIAVSSPEEGKRVESILARLLKCIGGDHTQDLARMLRLPGFKNVKDARNGAKATDCTIVECDASRRYSFDILCERLPDAQEPDSVEAGPAPGDGLAQLKPHTRRTIELLVAGLKNVPTGKRSHADYHALVELVQAGITQDAAWHLVKDRSKFAERGHSYFLETWKKATAAARARRPAEPQPPTEWRLDVVRMDAVSSETQKFLWHGRIPAAACILIGGRQGETKNLFAYDIIARTTTGTPWPDAAGHDRRKPADAILLEAEEHLESSIKPRLEAAGADCARVHFVRSAFADDLNRPHMVSIARDCERMTALAQEIGNVGLIVISPITSYLGEVEQNSNEQVRNEILTPLKNLAEKTGAAVVLLKHPNKVHTNTDPIERIGGSAAWTEAMRCVIFIGRDPDEDEEEKNPRRSAHWVKYSIGPKPDPLSWKVHVTDNNAVAIHYLSDPVTYGADEILARRRKNSEKVTKQESATLWVADYLQNGPTQLKNMNDAALTAIEKERKFSNDAYERAKNTMWKAGRLMRERKPGQKETEYWVWMADKAAPEWHLKAESAEQSPHDPKAHEDAEGADSAEAAHE